MKIVQLTAENVKRLTAISIKPDGSTVIIGGRNGAGKTSVLDSIMYALAGGDSLPSKPLRKGSDKGQVTVDLGELTVTRRFRKGKDTDEVTTTLEVKRANGDRASTPQAVLDELCGKMAFDPLEFSRMKPKAQLDAIKELVGLDFTEADRIRARLYDQRTEINRQAKSKAAELAATPQVDAPESEVSVAALMEELNTLTAANRQNEKLRESLDKTVKANEGCWNAVRSWEREVDDLKQKLAAAEEGVKASTAAAQAHDATLAKERELVAGLTDADTDSIRQQITDAELTNRKVRQNAQHKALEEAANALLKQADELTDKIKAIDDVKADKMGSAPFPVSGLGFDSDGVTLNGLPFSQASSAEQLRVSVAMGLALNPKLKVLLIRDGSLLDDESLALVASMADEADAQVWLERVGEGQEVSVIIEDGHVKAAVEQEEAAAM